MKKRVLALLLVSCIAFGNLPQTAFAQAEEDIDGLCQHHPSHTTECGYAGEVKGAPCVHTHDDLCSYVKEAAEIPCNKGCTETDDGGQLIHTDGCAYTSAVPGSDCTHEHDEACGYIEASGGHACEFICEVCQLAPGASKVETPEPDGTDPAEKCICENLCTEALQNPDCPACAADISSCAPQPEEQSGSAHPAIIAEWSWEKKEMLVCDPEGKWEVSIPAEIGVPTREELKGLLPAIISAKLENVPAGNIPEEAAGIVSIGGSGLMGRAQGGDMPSDSLTGETSNSEGNGAATPAPDSLPRERVDLPLSWDLEAYPEKGGSPGGAYEVFAKLPAGYLLKDMDAGAIPATIRLDKGCLREGQLDGHVVTDTVSPVGTVIDLFDYWIDDEDDRFAPDDKKYSDSNQIPFDPRSDQGINRGHSLKFGKDAGYGGPVGNSNGSINRWTQSDTPYFGIMENRLENGYPVLKADLPVAYNGDKDNTKKSKEESMVYLFDPEVEAAGKESFHNVGGLLQVDKQGYYYYNAKASAVKADPLDKDGYASANYAWFDEEAGNFVLYNTWGVKKRPQNDFNGQFFPFTQPETVFTENEQGQLVQKELQGDSPALNHYFGMVMTTRFVQKNGGTTPMGDPVTYEFAGDDDVWIFIDGVLVGDLGGNHDTASLSVDFSTGEIVINDDTNNKTTIRQQFEAAGAAADWGTGERKDTFADDTYHTLKFFYLERGNFESNLSLKFNLREIPESVIEKEDQEGEPVAGAEFSLYPADYQDGTYSIQQGYEDRPIYTDTTGEDGKFSIWDEQSNSPIAFREFYQQYNTQHFILREKTAPEGYSPAPNAWLHFDPDTSVIQAENIISSGIYGAPMQVITAPHEFRYYDHGAADPSETLNLNDTDLENLKIHAVVLKRVNQSGGAADTGSWAPVSGNFEMGWTIHHDPSKNEMENIVEAIQANDAVGVDNHFKLGTGGAFTATVEYLPGDIEDYYWYLMEKEGMSHEEAAQKARYSISYYYTKDGGDVTAENTYRVEPEGFGKEFSIRLHIPNIKNYLVVEKVDDTQTPVNGAGFALYQADENGGFTQRDDLLYDWAETSSLNRREGDKLNGEGLITFPSATMVSADDKAGKGILGFGIYYLVETAAPSGGYIRNETPVKVVVDRTGIYADAGTADDGISTRRAVGSVLRGMFHFARDDGIDATLHNIKAQQLTAAAYDGEGTSWSRWSEDEDRVEHHRYFAGDGGPTMTDYQPVPDTPALPVAEEGWTRLEVRLCEEHKDDPEIGLDPDLGSLWKGHLTGQDLNHLFSSALYITVENERENTSPPVPATGSLTVFKTVSGSGASREQAFPFTVKLDDASISGPYGEMGFVGGVATFTLKHGESKTAAGLPADIGYTVSETGSQGYTVTCTGEQGAIPAGGTAEARFENHKGSGGEEDDGLDLTVKKVWKLDDGGKAAEFVAVALLRDGKVEQTIRLSGENHWQYTWKGLDNSAQWSVREQAAPEGFEATVSREGMVFTITNDDRPDPDPDRDPPVDPGEPENPDDPDPSDDPKDPREPRNPEEPKLPQAGQLWWPVFPLLGGGIALVLVGVFGEKGEHRFGKKGRRRKRRA